MKRTAAEYSLLLELLDQALDLPAEERAAWLDALSGDALYLQATLRRLLSEASAPGEQSALPDGLEALTRDAAMHASVKALGAGTLIGPYRLQRELGRGGMGSVWLAERVDGAFERQVALKLPHLTWNSGLADRMVRERSILAGLEHPGIARLYEGGVTSDGRPFMAMEYIEGENLLQWCKARQPCLEQRLRFFAAICDAVSYAHSHLVVHRDLKPANIFVTADGRVKLLDFGIAKLLDAGVVGDASLTAHLSPAYAAPEQLSGRVVTTATDVYGLGVTLFELLTGRLPWLVADLPLAVAVRRLEQAAPRLSAAVPADGAVSARQLRGDLDAIVAKTLRTEPAARYPDARTLAEDIQRHLRHEPIQARSGARAYVLRLFLRRYWVPLGATAVVFAALAIGIGVAVRQTHRAEGEASRADATKDFLVSLFRASDPRVAQDTARTELTAKQLLDLGSGRIDRDFANQPELQIELLGLTADIYNHLNDQASFNAVEKHWLERATAYYGPAHPTVIRGRLGEADAACAAENFDEAGRILDATDVLLRTSGQDRSFLRALWWRERGRLYKAEPNGRAETTRSLNQALALFARFGPTTSEYAAALNQAAADAAFRGEALEAKRLSEQALAIDEKAVPRDDANISIDMNNLARKYERLGLFDQAEAMYGRAEAQELRTFGAHDITYWYTRAYHARLLHLRGQRDSPDSMFRQVMDGLPKNWKKNSYDSTVREVYADRLAAEGRAREAIPLLEGAQRAYLTSHSEGFSIREVRRELGNAYDAAGQTDDARAMLLASRDEYIANESAGSEYGLRARERWARFLLDHSSPGQPEFNAAEDEFKAVVTQSGDRPWIEAAQVHAGLARIALARGEPGRALAESRHALDSLEQAQGLYDARIRSQIWLVNSAVLLASGDAPGAQEWAAKALQASRLSDVADAESIKRALAALQLADARLPPAAVSSGTPRAAAN